MYKQKILAVGLVVSSLFIAYSVVAQTDAPSSDDALQKGAEAGITFPIPELGNCGSKNACKAYCESSDHMTECIAFAKEHGLMNKDEAARAEKFRSTLQSGGGPGGCRSPKECEAFCSTVKNIDACVKFAEAHGIKDKNIDEGKKLSAYLKSGGQTPGGCDSRDACETYCRDFTHVEECFAFAEKSGVGPGTSPGQFGREENGPRPEDLKKLVELVKQGQTPGGCTSKDACEAYCKDQAHRDECVEFGVKAGFIQKEHADVLKKTGGKGPGGCEGQACRDYCNQDANREACFKFAEENGLIPKEQLEEAKQGLVRMRAGLENAPPEVRECLASTLGQNILLDMQAGKLMPGPEIGEKIRGCFEKFGGRVDPQKEFNSMPADMRQCVKEKLGSDFEKIKSGILQMTPEMADAMRVCFGQKQFMEGGHGPRGEGDGQGMGFGQFLRGAPPQIVDCVKNALGGDFEAMMQGKMPQADMKVKVEACFKEFKPQMSVMQGSGMPDEMKRCMVQIFGAEADAQMSTGAFKNDPTLRAKLESCMKQAGGMMGGQSGIPGSISGGSAMGMPDAMRKCWTQIFGAEPTNPPDTSVLKDPALQEKLRACMGAYQPTGAMIGKPPLEGGGASGVGAVPTRPFDGAQDKPSISPAVMECLKSNMSEDQIRQLMSGNTADLSDAAKKCFMMQGGVMPREGTMPPLPSGGLTQPGVCPMMPTVESCPAGQVKKQVFSSPECGTYYACVPDGTAYPSQYPTGGTQYQYPTQPPPTEITPLPPPPAEPPPQTNAASRSFLGSVLQAIGAFFGIK